MRRGLDVSNWTGAPDRRWDALNAGGRGVLFVQAIDPPAGYPPGVTAQQVQWGLDNGWDVVAYVWKWFSTGIEDIQRRVDLLEAFTGQILTLALDVEDTSISTVAVRGAAAVLPPEHLARMQRQPPPLRPATVGSVPMFGLPLQARLDQLNAAFQALDAFPRLADRPSDYYGGRWYHVPYLGDTTIFAEQGRGLWAAQYDGVYDVAELTLFGGWTADQVVAKQPQGDVVIGGVSGLDADVCADWLARPEPPQPDQPADDPPWVAKKTRVVELAGELLAVADQLDEAAEMPSRVHELADGVRARAGEILA